MKSKDTSSKKIYSSILNFVDLAGSERGLEFQESEPPTPKSLSVSRGNSNNRVMTSAEKSSAKKKERFSESKFINKSLFYLTQVISRKAQKDLHIPYRNSPLTKILKSSLGGNSRTCVILCVNPCESQTEQTLSTLRFGINASKIQNRVEPNCIEDNSVSFDSVVKEYESKIQRIEKEKEELEKKLLENQKTIKNQNYEISKAYGETPFRNSNSQIDSSVIAELNNKIRDLQNKNYNLEHSLKELPILKSEVALLRQKASSTSNSNSSQKNVVNILQNRNSESLAILPLNSLIELEQHLEGVLQAIRLEISRKKFMEKAMISGESSEFITKAMKIFSETKSELPSMNLDFSTLLNREGKSHKRGNSLNEALAESNFHSKGFPKKSLFTDKENSYKWEYKL